MYGYVVPDKSKLKQEEFVLFSAFYCGMCITIGNRFGQFLRYSTNYDIAFFTALMFDQLNADAQIVLTKCISNPFKNRPIIKQNELMNKIADVNIILAYYKILDNVLDKKRGAKTALKFITKHFDLATKRQPNVANICKNAHINQQKLEQSNQKSIDIASDCFASQLRNIASDIIPNANPNLAQLCYNIGKFVYLADAVDDISEDNKKSAFNPFLINAQNPFVNRKQFIQDNYNQISFCLNSTVNRAIECFNCLNFNQSYGLLENIVYYGLRKKVDELLKSSKKLAKPKL